MNEFDRILGLALEVLGTGHTPEIKSLPRSEWWEVRIDNCRVYRGSVSQCLAFREAYEAAPHIVITSHGDPVCCN